MRIPSHAGWMRLARERARSSTALPRQSLSVTSTGSLRTFAGRTAGRSSCMTGTALRPARKQRWPAQRPRSSHELTSRALRRSTRASVSSTRTNARAVVHSRRKNSGLPGPQGSGYEPSMSRTTASCEAAIPRSSPTKHGCAFAELPVSVGIRSRNPRSNQAVSSLILSTPKSGTARKRLPPLHPIQ